MIKVIIKRNAKEFSEITIKGHANSNINNEFDLVCSGVSAVVYGVLNSLDDNLVDIKVKDGFVSIIVKKFSKDNNIILKVLKTSLETIAQEYKKYISIKEEVI